MKRRVRERAHAKGLSAGYLEGDEDEEEDEDISISAIKNKYKQGKKGRYQKQLSKININ